MAEESSEIPRFDEQPSSLGDWLVWLGFQAIGYSFMIALVGLMGSTFARVFGENASLWGWAVGALLAAVGYPLGWVRMENARLSKLCAAEQEKEERRPRQAMARWKGSLVGLVIGAILGLVVGMTGVVYYLSFLLSPFAAEPFALDAQSITRPGTVIFWILGCAVGGVALLFLLFGLFGQVYDMQKPQEAGNELGEPGA
jgi:MFS family permease